MKGRIRRCGEVRGGEVGGEHDASKEITGGRDGEKGGGIEGTHGREGNWSRKRDGKVLGR